MLSRNLYAVVIATGLFAVGPGARAESTDEDAIRAVRASSNQALANHDIEALKATWLPNLHVTGSNGDIVAGGDAMARIFTGVFSDPDYIIYVRSPGEIHLSPGEGYAAESGEWTGRWKDGDNELSVTGSYMAQWHKVAEGWRIRSELYVALSCEGSEKCQTLQ